MAFAWRARENAYLFTPSSSKRLMNKPKLMTTCLNQSSAWAFACAASASLSCFSSVRHVAAGPRISYASSGFQTSIYHHPSYCVAYCPSEANPGARHFEARGCACAQSSSLASFTPVGIFIPFLELPTMPQTSSACAARS